jgi:hypothetical protein
MMIIKKKTYFGASTVWCWKTSLVRETARRLSEKQNAMIVDTSNEICVIQMLLIYVLVKLEE